MRKTLLSAAGALVLAVAFTGAAQAQCWWNGYSYSCVAPQTMYDQPQMVYSDQPYWNPGSPYAAYNSYDYRDYRYQPNWLPSFPGPRPGGH